jgi:hypothetical protein
MCEDNEFIFRRAGLCAFAIPPQAVDAERERIKDAVARFHRNSCYPDAMSDELDACADAILVTSPLDGEVKPSTALATRPSPADAVTDEPALGLAMTLDVEERYLLAHFDADNACDIMPGDVQGSFHRIREAFATPPQAVDAERERIAREIDPKAWQRSDEYKTQAWRVEQSLKDGQLMGSVVGELEDYPEVVRGFKLKADGVIASSLRAADRVLSNLATRRSPAPAAEGRIWLCRAPAGTWSSGREEADDDHVQAWQDRGYKCTLYYTRPSPAPAAVEAWQDIAQEARFLLDRLEELDDANDVEYIREFEGHVRPPMSRLRRLLPRDDRGESNG